MERPNAWKSYSPEQLDELHYLCEGYKAFISDNKTERECCAAAVDMAREAGYVSLEEAVAAGKKLEAGAKLYAVNRAKSLMLVNLGSDDLEAGVNILGAHIDSPRMDVKQNPMDEKNDLVTLDTHYYGGIKKYQWVTIPLAIHGVVVHKDGEVVKVNIGEDEADPVFCVTDLLIHLAQEQMTKDAAKVVDGEMLDVLCGGRPVVVKDGDAQKDGAADEKDVARTSVTLLVDKEEIGSVGATGMTSRFFENTMAEVLALAGKPGDLALRRCLAASQMLSSDVSAGFDPTFASAFEAKNASYLGRGLTFNKFTGSRGKSGSNDADAEYVAKVRRVMDEGGVNWQTAELGRVDLGGGGTIAYILAKYDMSVIDCGVPVLSMHAPWETTSKADIYEAYRGYRAFLQKA